MAEYFSILKREVSRIRERANERSYYPLLCDFFKNFGVEEKRRIDATPEETSPVKGVGLPDITIRENDHIVGWVEVKLPEDNLDDAKFSDQFSKYKESLENVLFTNLKQWQLYQWDKDHKPQKIADIFFDVLSHKAEDEEKLENILRQFFEGKTLEVKTSQQLASALAKKAKLLSHQVEESFDENNQESELTKLKNTLQQTLIRDLSVHQFANMMAETLTYSLFLAALEHVNKSNKILDLTTAVDYLPSNVPILSDLYSLVKKISKTLPNMYRSAELIIEQLNKTDIASIRNVLTKHKPGEDPVIQFYEPFLAEYDPKERKRRGVYYTPKPIVDYIIRAVNIILKEKFDKAQGLAEKEVYLLDPATGTGTFLMSAMQKIYNGIAEKNAKFGKAFIEKEFNEIMAKHILKDFYGFEILVAPYVIAHLKLTLEAEHLGFNFLLTKNDGDPDDDRFKVYLANTLDDPGKPSVNLFGFESIPRESEEARKVKENVPILAIVGNPPYSNFGRMNRTQWILGLLQDYKKGLEEKKINLDDDFIKFIRFAQWKLEKTGQGIFAMITSNTFIDGITHRQMRRSLMDTFDEIYIYNLHGNSRRGEVAPDGSKDGNVFNIQQGVSINIFIKMPKKQGECVVKYCDLWGLREYKFATLLNEKFDKTKWQTLLPKKPNWFFVIKEEKLEEEYLHYLGFADIAPVNISGVTTSRDDFVLSDDPKQLEKRIHDFITLDEAVLAQEYNLKDNISCPIEKAKRLVKFNTDEIKKIAYRIFDDTYIYYSDYLIHRSRRKVMKNFFKKNLGIVLMRQSIEDKTYTHVLATNKMIDNRFFSSSRGTAYVFPLYIYSSDDTGQSDLLGNETKKLNLTPDFIKKFSGKLGLDFVSGNHGDLTKTFGPEDIFYYAYAILHSPIYRTRYDEQLKIDFPRLPITSDRELFKRLVVLGNELVNLHLLGENPFDSSKTILDEPGKWTVKIGGTCPANLEDWKVADVCYKEKEKRVYANAGQYFEGVEKQVWEFMIGGYQVLDKWLKYRKKVGRSLSAEEIKTYMKIVVALRETILIMKEIDKVIDKHGSWPIK